MNIGFSTTVIEFGLGYLLGLVARLDLVFLKGLVSFFFFLFFEMVVVFSVDLTDDRFGF